MSDDWMSGKNSSDFRLFDLESEDSCGRSKREHRINDDIHRARANESPYSIDCRTESVAQRRQQLAVD